MSFPTGQVIAASTLDRDHAGRGSGVTVGYIVGFIALFSLSGLAAGIAKQSGSRQRAQADVEHIASGRPVGPR